jgi:hypothetical protein
MSRPVSTEEENICGTALLEYLNRHDITASIVARDVNDKPDLCFNFNGKIIGCECVQIPPGRIYKYLHSRFKQLEKSDSAVVRVIWPQEQHYWVKETIESKTKKVGAYQRNCSADKIWLLIHAPISETDTSVGDEKDEIMALIKYSAKKTPHNFDEIYFWSPKQGITKIFPVDGVWDQVEFNFEGGYPTSGFLMSKGKFRTTEEGEPPVLYDSGLITPNVIIVPPQDPEFKKHEPNYKSAKYRLKVLAGATDAQTTFETVADEPF